ncbi:MAG: glycosyltransferase family 2 protein [Verrucomicrobiota bacterium]|nr:glycosyltransferase family 2 protein [Verrucomicrobiota bacterium]
MEALGRQTLAKNLFHVWIIDNGSEPSLHDAQMQPLRQAEVTYSILPEPRLGNVFAREKAITSTSGEWIVFVDDDNELADDYLASVMEIIARTPQLGAFGGKLLLAGNICVPAWVVPLLANLAIKDCGDQVISSCAAYWGPWEPPTAGAAVNRRVLNAYLEKMKMGKGSDKLGRKGKKGLLSSEDSLMMRGAFNLGLYCAYQPRLKLKHHIEPRRFRFGYLVRLMYNYGRSHVILDRSLGHPVPRAKIKRALKLMTRFPKSRLKICRLAWDWGYFFESRADH